MKHKHLINLSLGIAAVGAIVWGLTPAQYPPHTLPPVGWGTTNPAISQTNVSQTICNPKWSTSSIRPSSSYTTALKIKQLKEMGYADQTPADYEEDHLISLELGGAPSDPNNLWPEGYVNPVGNLNLGAHEKDKAENYLHAKVCDGSMTLIEAQEAIKTDWVKVWAKLQGYNIPPSNTDD